MARNFASASSESAYVATTGTYQTSLSFAARVRLTSTPADGAQAFVFSLGNVGGAGSRLNLYLSYRNVSGTLRWNLGYTNGDGSYNENYYDDTLSTATWYAVAGSVDWSINPDTVTVYRDGSALTLSGTYGSNNVTPDSGSYRLTVGALAHANSAATSFWNGDIAELALWNGAINAGEHAALYAGASPMLIRTGGLVANLPFLGGVNCRINGAGTDVNSTSNTDHPPKIMYPRLRRFFAPSSAAPPADPGGTSGYKPFKGPFGHPFNVPF